jgi:hypothetical protein
MTDYFCPECKKSYTMRELDLITLRIQEAVTVAQVAGHFLCSCGYEGSLYEDSEEGRNKLKKFYLNWMHYCEDILTINPGDKFYIEEKKKATEKYQNLSGEDVVKKTQKTKAVSAFSRYLSGDEDG